MENKIIDLDYLCRLCLEEVNEEKHHIFEEKLSNKIIILTSLDVEMNDPLPKFICKECRYQLEKSHYFRNQSKLSDSRLKKHIRLINQNKISIVLEKDYTDDYLEEINETFMESYKYFEEAQNQIDNLRLEFELEKSAIIEEELKKIKRAEEDKAAAQKLKRSNSKPPVLLNKCAPENQKFTPMIVRKNKKDDQKNSSVVSEYIVGNYEIQIVSPDLDETYQVEETPEVEIENVQIDVREEFEESPAGSDEEYKPPKLKKKKKTQEKPPKTPVRTEPSEENYFKAIEEVDEKDLDENGERKIFQCGFEDCSEKFARRQACKTHYYNHLTTQIISNGFTCNVCKKTFKVASALDRHERVHTGEKPYCCDFKGCEKSFSQKEMLKRHKIIHMSIEDAPFACKFCKKRFRQKEPLRLHISKEHSEDSETNSKSFVCTICNKSFAHSSGLSRHFLIHSGKTFSCEICGKGFNDKSALKRHGSVHKK